MFLQESTIGAAFLTKTIPDLNVKFEIWWDRFRLLDSRCAAVYRAWYHEEAVLQASECSLVQGRDL